MTEQRPDLLATMTGSTGGLKVLLDYTSPLLDDARRHRLRCGALHLPARSSRQNAK
jgi:hypothetical protein